MLDNSLRRRHQSDFNFIHNAVLPKGFIQFYPCLYWKKVGKVGKTFYLPNPGWGRMQLDRYHSVFSSDHQPIVLTVERRYRLSQHGGMYNCNEANWRLYYVHQTWERLPDLKRGVDLEKYLTQRILSAQAYNNICAAESLRPQ